MSAPFLLGGAVFEIQKQPADPTRLKIPVADSAGAAVAVLNEISHALLGAGYAVKEPKRCSPNFARLKCRLSRESDIEIVLVDEGNSGQIERFCLMSMAFVDKTDTGIRRRVEEQWQELAAHFDSAVAARYAVVSILHLSPEETAERDAASPR